MTTLKERLRADLNVNIKAGKELEKTTLRNVLGAIQSAEKSGKVEVEFDDAQVEALLAKEVKKREATAAEYIEAAAKIGDKDNERVAKLLTTVDREQAEAEVLKVYLPEGISEAELDTIIAKALVAENATTAKDMGRVMKLVRAEVGNRADGKLISDKVRAALA
jgi:uncharacterized protein YqeY